MISRSDLLQLDLDEFSEAELYALMRRICDTLQDRAEVAQFSPEEVAEFERRMAEADANPSVMISLEELQARMKESS